MRVQAEMNSAEPRPTAIELDRSTALTIRWSDGEVSVYPLAALRRACPCAGCKGEREQASKTLLPVAAPLEQQREMSSAEGVELVGRYALKMTWRDGHDTGIYDYAMLRSLAREISQQMQ